MLFVKALLALVLGLLTYIVMTVLFIGTLFVIRTVVLLFTDFDMFDSFKQLADKHKVKSNKKQRLVESSDTEWLKDRGRG